MSAVESPLGSPRRRRPPVSGLLHHLLPLLALLIVAGLPRLTDSACNSSLSISDINETTAVGYAINAIDSSYQTTLFGQPQYLCYFEVSAGFLRLARSFDLENFTSCSDGSTIPKSTVPTAVTVTIQCASSSDTATFLIRLVDVNEFPPMFVPNYYSVNVSEAASVNTLIVQLNTHVVDLDKSNQLTFNFLLVNGTQGSFYIIDGVTSGMVRLQRALDFDAGPRQYVMTVAAAELPSEPASQPAALTGYATLVVNVLDYDDQNPVFSQNSYSLYFMENNTNYMNTPLTTSPPLLAFDQDVGINQTINYAIVSGYWWTSSGSQINNASFLTINTTTGQFSIVSLIDREALPTSQLFVLVKGYQTDKPDTRVALALVLVTVGDKNDNSPAMSAQNYSADIPENSPAGSFVVGVSATDRDLGENATVRYYLNDPSGAFQIDATSGHVTVANASLLDREATPEFNLTVWSEEAATPERYASPQSRLTIRLLDVNDNSPVFSNGSRYSVTLDRSVATSGTPLLTLVATDADIGVNGQLKFSLVFVSVPGPESFFNVDSGSGAVSVAAGLSSFPADQLLLTVMVEDGALPVSSRRSSVAVIALTLTNSMTTSSTVSTMAATTIMTSSSTATSTATTMPTTLSTSTPAIPTTTTVATTATPAEMWNASTSVSAVWLVNSSHVVIELRTTHKGSSGNQTVTTETVALPVNASLIAQLSTTSSTTTSTTSSSSSTTSSTSTPRSTTESNATAASSTAVTEPVGNRSTTLSTDWATTTTTVAPDEPTLQQPPPLALIVACALLAVATAMLALVLGYVCFERSRLKALASEQAATIESLQQKSNPIFSNGQQQQQPNGEIGPESVSCHSQRPDGSAAIYVSQQLAPDPAYQTLSFSMAVTDF